MFSKALESYYENNEIQFIFINSLHFNWNFYKNIEHFELDLI